MPENDNDRTVSAPVRGRIDKQIVLPWSKAIEISAKSMKVRFWRSIITMGSIILAIAFLSSILTTTTIVGSLRRASVDPSVEEKVRSDIRHKLNIEGAAGSEADNGLQASGGLAQGDASQTPAATSDPNAGFFERLIKDLTPRDKWLVVLALLVCFVGIVNAMLMSVTERFREIGTMKCLGALDSFIVKLFLLEASFQGIVGTVFGIILGAILSVLRASWAYGFGNTFRFFPIGGILFSALLALVAGSILSVIAALFPARAAARMQPVEALRSEQ